jgi:hypothetical protein
MDLLQELLAEREIRKIVALYPQYADNADEVAWAALFVEDGELCIGDTVIKGREALAAWLLGTLKGPPMRHMMLNSFIDVMSEDSARGSLDMALLLRKDDRWELGPAPRYDDQYVRTADGWKFARRRLHIR